MAEEIAKSVGSMMTSWNRHTGAEMPATKFLRENLRPNLFQPLILRSLLLTAK